MIDDSPFAQLKGTCEHLIRSLDAALNEAKKCRESLLLFVQVSVTPHVNCFSIYVPKHFHVILQFVRDFSQDTNEVSFESR